jgi:hypothetical protein
MGVPGALLHLRQPSPEVCCPIRQTSTGEKMKVLLLLTAVASASIAAGAGSQVTTAKPDSSCTNYPDGRVECKVFRRGPADSLKRTRYSYRMDSVLAKRAALGIELRSTATRRDTLGVFVDAVTPKGPAETAGIVEGDRIAAINGVDLRSVAADTEDSYTNGLAAHRLTREVEKLSPGARVTLRVYSGGRFRDVQVTAGKASDVMRLGGRFGYRGPGGGAMRFGPEMMMMFGPEMPMLKQKMEHMDPMVWEKMDPMVWEKLKKNLPEKIQLRTPQFRMMMPRTPMIYKVEGDWDDAPEFQGDFDFDADDDFDFDVGPVTTEEIRELVGISVRDAQSALARLAAEQAA